MQMHPLASDEPGPDECADPLWQPCARPLCASGVATSAREYVLRDRC
jgi:hypothetical protein